MVQLNQFLFDAMDCGLVLDVVYLLLHCTANISILGHKIFPFSIFLIFLAAIFLAMRGASLGTGSG